MIVTDSFGFNDEGAISLPRGRPGLGAFVVDIQKALKAKSRMHEIARATPVTAPELLTTFILGTSELTRAITMVELEKRAAKRELEISESIFMLERCETYLKTKNIKSSVDTRESAVKLDPAVKSAQEVFDLLESMLEYLYHEYKDLERAYYGVKEVCSMFMKAPSERARGDYEQYD